MYNVYFSFTHKCVISLSTRPGEFQCYARLIPLQKMLANSDMVIV